MGKKTMEEIRKEVLELQGKTIGTLWGPSQVVRITEQDGVEYVHLREFGEEDYTVELEQFPECRQ